MPALDITTMIDRYGRLEQRVRMQMERQCQATCSHCRQVCCRIHFCAETRESAFLQRVVRRFSPKAEFDPQCGWLSPAGCTLVAGRPPVCYEFLCGDIPGALSGDIHHRHGMLALSMLITHTGRRAIGGRHLVEATRDADLRRIHPQRFMARLDEAEAALEEVVAVLDGRRSYGAAARTLSRIAPPPRTDA